MVDFWSRQVTSYQLRGFVASLSTKDEEGYSTAVQLIL